MRRAALVTEASSGIGEATLRHERGMYKLSQRDPKAPDGQTFQAGAL